MSTRSQAHSNEDGDGRDTSYNNTIYLLAWFAHEGDLLSTGSHLRFAQAR